MVVGLTKGALVFRLYAAPPAPTIDLFLARFALSLMLPNLSLCTMRALLSLSNTFSLKLLKSNGVGSSGWVDLVDASRKASVEASLWESSVARWGASGARAMALAWWVKVKAARAAERKRVVRILGEGVGDESLGFFLL